MHRMPSLRGSTSGFPSVLAILIAGLALATSIGLASPAAPAFKVASPDPEVTARTLDALAQRPDAQTQKIWVTFTDKQIFDSATCEARLSEVRDALDPRAVDRRRKAIPGLVDFHDIPVPEAYVAELEARGAEIVRRSRWLNAVSVRAPLESLREIGALPFVEKLVPVGVGRNRRPVGLDPRPPGSSEGGQRRQLFDYGESLDQLTQIRVVEAHDAGYSGAGIIVAMLDTGFKHTHPAFADIVNESRLIAQWDFVNDDGETQNEPGDDEDSHNHGTYTWSALGGFYDGELVGPAYGASFILAKTEDVTSETPVEEDNWVAAAEWVDGLGADVISSSLSYLDWYTTDDLDGDTAVITIAADLAVGRGIVVVNSAGNEGSNDWQKITPPADGDSVFAVGAVDAAGILAGFSSLGPTTDGRIKPDMVARGVETYCAVPEEFGVNFWWLSGTSLSCPLVGGAVALILEANPEWTPMTVWSALTSTADRAANPDTLYGWGLIDVMAAIDSPVSAPEITIGPTTPQLWASPNPLRAGTRLDFLIPSGVRGAVALEIFDIGGRRVRLFDSVGAGRSLAWDGRNDGGREVAPGIYLAQLRAGDWRATTKLVVQR